MTDCDKWRLNPLVNPKTGRSIKHDGPTYRAIMAECDKETDRKNDDRKNVDRKTADRKTADRKNVDRKTAECDKWRKNPLVNPCSGRNIKKGGPTYKALEKKCGQEISHQQSIRKSQVNQNRLSDRIVTANFLKQTLSHISPTKFDTCMSGPNTDYRDQLDQFHFIGRGMFGDVYKAKINDKSVVVKEAYMTPAQRSRFIKGKISPEYYIQTLVNEILDARQCQNFLFTYMLSACDGCRVGENKLKTPKTCFVTFMEAADSNFDCNPDWTDDNIVYIALQILFGLYSLHSQFGVIHEDIKLDNILIKHCCPGGYFKYTINGEKFYIENIGIIPCIADFGVSYSIKPLYGDQIPEFQKRHGSRNAMVSECMGEKYWDPITCVYSSSTDKTGKVVKVKPNKRIWKNKQGNIINATWNIWNGSIDLLPNIPTDLNDTLTFPPFECFNDIQDVLRMFVGGKRTTQQGMHKEFVKRQITAISSNVIDRFPYRTHGTVKYIRTDEMIRDIYSYISQPKTVYVVDAFNL